MKLCVNKMIDCSDELTLEQDLDLSNCSISHWLIFHANKKCPKLGTWPARLLIWPCIRWLTWIIAFCRQNTTWGIGGSISWIDSAGRLRWGLDDNNLDALDTF